jgi:malto-oligosyltrehalose trehalohydrolase
MTAAASIVACRTFTRELPFGAQFDARRGTAFRLWAPGQKRVSLAIEDGDEVPMTRGPDGVFEARVHCSPGTGYRYRLESGQLVPDPAARAQRDDIHGPSLVIDSAGYRWKHPDWKGRPWRETVLYELHVGACGGFAGVVERLAGLSELGVTAVELMPVNDFPGTRNWGYDGVLPFAPDRAYGSPDELKALVDAAHEHGLMIFLDVVYNHFGPDGNYLPSYAPAFFRDDVKTPWGPAIDFRRPEVRRFFAENALYWLMEYRFDGLRFDAVHAIADQDWPDELAAEIRRTVEPGRFVHLVLEHEDNIAHHLRRGFDAQWNDDAHHVVHSMLTGEADGYYADYAARATPLLARCLAEGFAYQGENSAIRKGEPRGTPSADLPPTAFVFFLQNHDQIGNRPFGERLLSLAPRRRVVAAVALQLLCPHIPLLFMGEENASPTPFLYFTDHHGDLAAAVREGRRREFAHFAAFAAEETRATIPDPNDRATFERSRPVPGEDATEMRALYAELLRVRRSTIVPHLDGARALGAEVIGPRAVVARWVMGDGSLLTVASNLGNEAQALPQRPGGELIFSSSPGDVIGWLLAASTMAFLERGR